MLGKDRNNIANTRLGKRYSEFYLSFSPLDYGEVYLTEGELVVLGQNPKGIQPPSPLYPPYLHFSLLVQFLHSLCNCLGTFSQCAENVPCIKDNGLHTVAHWLKKKGVAPATAIQIEWG